MIKFEEGKLIKGAYVVVDGKELPVHMPQYEGNTPLSPENLNKLQKDLQEEIQGTRLYKNETGTAGDIILNESIENYNSYKIYGYYNHLGNYTKFCKEFDVDSRNRIDLSGNSYNGGSFTYFANEIATISGNRITRGTQYEDSLAGGGVDNSRSSGEYVYITKVVAYK